MRGTLTRLGAAVALTLLIGWSAPARAAADRREALVIGNGAYLHAPALPNPTTDAAAIADGLEKIGFDVMLRTDLDRRAMGVAFRDFGDKAEHADIALVYYAGHGLQLAHGNGGENYLVPTDARLLDARDVDDEAYSLDRVLERLEGAQARIVILDACRDNPLASRMRAVGGTRSISRGLARVDATSPGTLLVFSTEPGAMALDSGDGGNSPFAAAMLRNLAQPGMEIRQMLTRVRAEVYQKTDHHQTPWSNDGLFQEVFLVPPVAPAAPPAPSRPAPPDARLDTEFWASAKDSTDPRDLEAYLAKFPDGAFTALAHNRLERLRAGVAPGPVPGPSPGQFAALTAPPVKPDAKPVPATRPPQGLPDSPPRDPRGQVGALANEAISLAQAFKCGSARKVLGDINAIIERGKINIRLDVKHTGLEQDVQDHVLLVLDALHRCDAMTSPNRVKVCADRSRSAPSVTDGQSRNDYIRACDIDLSKTFQDFP